MMSPHVPSPTYLRSHFSHFQYSQRSVNHDIVVFTLVNPRLRQLKVPGRSQALTEAELIHTEASEYPHTRTWAQFFHTAVSMLAGLAWRPRLGGTGTAYVLFEDRAASALKLLKRPFAAVDPGVARKLARVAKGASIRLI